MDKGRRTHPRSLSAPERGAVRRGDSLPTGTVTILRSMRRALGFVSMLLMLHLTLVGSDRVCAKHGVDATAAAMHGSSAHSGMSHEQNHPAQTHGEQKEQCETPISQDCCSALTSCSPTIVVASATTVVRAMSADADRPLGPQSSMLSRVPAPEPPPPRA